MARMYPEKFPEFTDQSERRRKEAEKQIYQLLSRRLPQAFTVFWSVNWLAKRRSGEAIDGEADFIVIHPQHGVLLIEVKGGNIRYDGANRQWTSTDRDGKVHQIQPFDQVRRQFYSLRSKLQESPLTAPFSYPIARAVWFPTLRVNSIDLGLDAPRDIILDADDFVDPLTAILDVFEYWSGQAQHRPSRARTSSNTFGQAAIDSLVRLLAPTYEILTPLIAEFRQEQEVTRQLTEEQFTVLDELASYRRACISGFAGSGKTMLAVEKARRLANEGYSVLLTCYNRNLADFLATSLSSNENISVYTYSKLCEEYADAARFEVTRDRSVPGYYEKVLPNAMVEAVKYVVTRFDAIVVDEGQDFDADWWIPLQLILSDPNDGVMYIFFDDNQKIYSTRLVDFPFREPLFHLTVNCRNTQAIHQTVLKYYRGNRQLVCPGAEGRSVEVRQIHNTSEAAQEELRRVLHHLVYDNGVPTEDIIILTPIKRGSMWREGSRIGNFTLTWFLQPRANEIACSTIQGFKGLERPLVIVTEMDKAYGNLETLNYVALSRATNHLIVLQQA